MPTTYSLSKPPRGLHHPSLLILVKSHEPHHHLLSLDFSLPKQQARHGLLVGLPPLRCTYAVEKHRAPLRRRFGLVHPDVEDREGSVNVVADESGCVGLEG
jgi:hypothetical protein